jgi:hypothetical protein
VLKFGALEAMNALISFSVTPCKALYKLGAVASLTGPCIQLQLSESLKAFLIDVHNAPCLSPLWAAPMYQVRA